MDYTPLNSSLGYVKGHPSLVTLPWIRCYREIPVEAGEERLFLSGRLEVTLTMLKSFCSRFRFTVNCAAVMQSLTFCLHF